MHRKQRLVIVAPKTRIYIHTVLRQNKNDEHARGYIGTELNKAETITQVEVDKEDKTVSVVEAVDIRDREFEPFAFRINEEALPEPVESYLAKEKKIGRPTKEPFEPYKEFLRMYIGQRWILLLQTAILATTITI